MKKNIWKSVWAVLAGVLGIIIASTAVDGVLHLAGVYPPMPGKDDPTPPIPLTHGLALLASSYRLLIGVAGGYLTAKLAPDRPLWHAMILGYVGVALGLVGVVATWNLGLGPRWYPISLAVLAIPQCWLGGWLRERQVRDLSSIAATSSS
jgi:hypothetical protein